jgi:hypothetical protein
MHVLREMPKKTEHWRKFLESAAALDASYGGLAGLIQLMDGRDKLITEIEGLAVRIDTFVFSLSAKEDDLSQWRGYCPRSGGVSIGFSPKYLTKVADQVTPSASGPAATILIGCCYRLEEYERLIEDLLCDSSAMPTPVRDFAVRLVGWAPAIKHESFHAESEYRLVWQYVGQCDNVGYHIGKSFLVPHITIPLARNGDGLYPLESVIVGPTPHMEQSLESVRRLLKNCGFEIAPENVKPSRVPYRDW